ncbi:G-protein coupled receptor family C group 5 member B isoform X3 [Apteryx rowi]|uniref:G-protein coupled receptor family C group 5 member B isoform X3 n=1 Tax=Apteryx rowi TaxID=308060 RepID=UPI000E1CE6F2|nr:G-protein coupled receptor family C group 5 member B isoform X3 [Apteryx rowi]
MKTYPAIGFFLLFVISYGSSENSSTSRGCGLDLFPQYVYLCDLDAIWGIVLEAVAGAAWMTMYLFGNTELKRKDKWSDPTLAIALVSSGWVFVIFHAIPEVHCTILPSQQENTPNYFDTSQPRMRETAFEEDIQLPRSYMENKAFSMDEHNAALRTAGFRNGSLGSRPSAPFRSNVYQPTEMAVVLNGGTIPTAPPSYTGRHLW